MAELRSSAGPPSGGPTGGVELRLAPRCAALRRCGNPALPQPRRRPAPPRVPQAAGSPRRAVRARRPGGPTSLQLLHQPRDSSFHHVGAHPCSVAFGASSRHAQAVAALTSATGATEVLSCVGRHVRALHTDTGATRFLESADSCIVHVRALDVAPGGRHVAVLQRARGASDGGLHDQVRALVECGRNSPSGRRDCAAAAAAEAASTRRRRRPWPVAPRRSACTASRRPPTRTSSGPQMLCRDRAMCTASAFRGPQER